MQVPGVQCNPITGTTSCQAFSLWDITRSQACHILPCLYALPLTFYTSSQDALCPTIYCNIRSTPISRLSYICSGAWLHGNRPSSCLQSSLNGFTAGQVIYAEEPRGVEVMALVQASMIRNV